MTNQLADLSFEDALTELQDIVARLESSKLSLDETINDFRRGTELAAHCQQFTDAAPSWQISPSTFEAQLAVYRKDQHTVDRGLGA